jgi:hypothetical protein
MTTLINYSIKTAFPTPTIRPVGTDSIPVEQEADKPVVTIVPGQLFVPPLGYELIYLVPPPISGDVVKVLDFLKREIDRIGLAPVLFGLMQGEQSNAAQSTAIAVAKSILATGLKNICREFDRMAGLMMRMIEILDEPVPIWVTDGPKREWLDLGPEHIKGYYEVEHTLEAIIPAERQLKYMYLADAEARGYITKKRVREEGMDISAPEKEEEDRLLEDMEKDPRVLNVVMAKALEPWQGQANTAQGLAPAANLPTQMGGAGAAMAAGMGQGLQPGARTATPAPGVGRG